MDIENSARVCNIEHERVNCWSGFGFVYIPLSHILAAVGDIKRMNVCECEYAYCLSRLDSSFFCL